MLSDPEDRAEQPYEFSEPIIAASVEEATHICRLKAQEQGVKFKNIQEPSRMRPGVNQKYTCVFEGNPIEL